MLENNSLQVDGCVPMADNLQKRPSKGILKNSSSFDKQDVHSHAKKSKEATFDEMNIIATLHPPDKDYGHMKIDEPKTPFNFDQDELDALDAHALAEKIKLAAEKPPKFLQQQSDDDSDDDDDDDSDLTEEEKQKRKEFRQRRKKHYNEFYAVKLARKLLEEEDEDEDDLDNNLQKTTESNKSLSSPKNKPTSCSLTQNKNFQGSSKST